MTADVATRIPWLAPVEAAFKKQGSTGAFLVLFETYRPDLVRAMAHAFSMRFIDFRQQYLQPLGLDAARVPLARINEVIAKSHSSDNGSKDQEIEQLRGIVLHNVEALLATADRAARAAWMAEFVALPYHVPVFVPLAVFADEAPTASPRVTRIEGSCVPQEKLLFRLAGR